MLTWECNQMDMVGFKKKTHKKTHNITLLSSRPVYRGAKWFPCIMFILSWHSFPKWIVFNFSIAQYAIDPKTNLNPYLNYMESRIILKVSYILKYCTMPLVGVLSSGALGSTSTWSWSIAMKNAMWDNLGRTPTLLERAQKTRWA